MKNKAKSSLIIGVVAVTMLALSGIAVPVAAIAASDSQTVSSDWVEVRHIEEDYDYDWEVASNVTVVNGEIDHVRIVAHADEGGAVPPMHQPYYNSQKIIMEGNFEGVLATPEAVDEVDTVSGATHTSVAIKKATRNAVEKWLANMASAKGAIDAINAISTASDKAAAVAAARAAYDALDSKLQDYVSVKELQLLETAEAEIAAEAAPAVQPAAPAAAAKAANGLSVKAKKVTLKAKKLKKKAQKASALTIKGANGKVTVKIVKVNKKKFAKKFKIAANGKLTVAKKVKKGTYKLTVKVSAAGDAAHEAADKTVTVTVKVK